MFRRLLTGRFTLFLLLTHWSACFASDPNYLPSSRRHVLHMTRSEKPLQIASSRREEERSFTSFRMT
jgi:hypothetical protein